MQHAQERDDTTTMLREALRPSETDITEFNKLCAGLNLGRNSSVQLAALRTKFEYVLPRPVQEHELSGSVAITVQCAFPTRAVAQQAKVPPDATEDAQVPCLQQRPITAHMSTQEEAEIQANPESQDDTSTVEAELLHEDGRLRAASSVALSPEARRAAARDEWQREQAELGPAVKAKRWVPFQR